MKDVIGNEIKVGDKVVFIPQDGYTSQLSVGIVESFTDKKVRISVTNKAWNYSGNKCLKFPVQVAVVDKERQ